jgi:small GTP-binding protein
MNEEKFKIVIIGDSGVGKSCIINRLIMDQYDDQRCSTIGAAFFTQKISYKDNKFSLDYWDTAGQERFRSILPIYFRNVDILIIVIDVTINIKTQLEHWLNYYENIHFFDKSAINKKYKIILLFSKIDLVNNILNLTIDEKNIYKNYILDENVLFMSSKKNIGFVELKNSIYESVYKISENKKDYINTIKENINLENDYSSNNSNNNFNYYSDLIKKKCNFL